MTILLRVLLNSTKTQVISYPLFYIHSMNVLLDNSLKMVIQIMHFIYFFGNNVNAGVFALVHGKENDINVSI